MLPTTPDVHGRRRLVTALIPPLLVVAVLWIVFAFDRVYSLDLYRFGVYPRQVKGLLGILVSPFVHADLEHLVNNSAPILVLGWLLTYFYPKAMMPVTLTCWAFSGLWVWVTARENYHIGASGVIYGLAAFLFLSGVVRKLVPLMAVSLLIVFLYGSMVWGVLPLEPRISWESHLFGALAGLLMAWIHRKVPPAHVPPPLVLEDDPEEEEPSSYSNTDPGDEEVGPSPHARLDRDAQPVRIHGRTPLDDDPII